jgi:hypothetical protein
MGGDLSVRAVVVAGADVPLGAYVRRLDEAQAEAQHRIAPHLSQLGDRDALDLERIAKLVGDLAPVRVDALDARGRSHLLPGDR